MLDMLERFDLDDLLSDGQAALQNAGLKTLSRAVGLARQYLQTNALSSAPASPLTGERVAIRKDGARAWWQLSVEQREFVIAVLRPLPRQVEKLDRRCPCGACVTCACSATPRVDQDGLCQSCGGCPLASALHDPKDVPHVGPELEDEDERAKAAGFIASHFAAKQTSTQNLGPQETEALQAAIEMLIPDWRTSLLSQIATLRAQAGPDEDRILARAQAALELPCRPVFEADAQDGVAPPGLEEPCATCGAHAGDYCDPTKHHEVPGDG